MTNIKETAGLLSLREQTVSTVLEMAAEGATVPFMARYRKEKTGNLDEVVISSIIKTYEQLQELDKRRGTILKSIESQGKLTEQLKQQIQECRDPAVLEDLYLPYKQKRKTRGMAAVEKGLQPLADLILNNTDPARIEKTKFYGSEGQAESWDEALQGASDILADLMNEDSSVRQNMRQLFKEKSLLFSKPVKGKEEEGQKYRDYFNREEISARTPSHRILAMYRGAEEGYLKLKIRPEEDRAMSTLHRSSPVHSRRWDGFVEDLEKDCYKRLLAPSLETEQKKNLKEEADREAIRVFAENLRVLLMEPPLGQKATLAIDPGLRTGCKLVCLSPEGKLLAHDVIYPLQPHGKTDDAMGKIRKYVNEFGIESVAVGNGTGGRETQQFCLSLDCLKEIPVVLVNESGASIYSASETARKEFPDYDLTVRGAVSIGRRLMDPLAELVKLDPSSIGVGQYQHDVNQKLLKEALDEVVMLCVNSVGVELNTASEQLLSYVSGLNARTAAAIVAYRDENGAFKSRNDLKKVKGVGAKCFEQASGFLRIRNGKNPLDNTGIHPEQYPFIKELSTRLGISIDNLLKTPEAVESLPLEQFVEENRGMETLRDIIDELKQPGRDPREEFSFFEFEKDVNSIEDLQEEMILPGIVTNVTAFGAFVDIGVHQDGLVHISQLADRYVSSPSDIVKVAQKVKVKILDVDIPRKRISCSMRGIDQN
ncbi:MAG: Tex family protein [Spirochaetales bacterium]|nr:Tex family protein [Spirochaetales bacterium]